MKHILALLLFATVATARNELIDMHNFDILNVEDRLYTDKGGYPRHLSSAFINVGNNEVEIIMKKCTRCKQQKTEESFSWKNKKKGQRQEKCRPCLNAYKKERYDSQPPEYVPWMNMVRRCIWEGHPAYKNYGGRGISVCDSWRVRGRGFNNFLADMGKRPSDKHELDRIDNSGNYCPENCKWATVTEQARNRRTTVLSMDLARAIRSMHANGARLKLIADMLGISSVSHLWQVVDNKIWREA